MNLQKCQINLLSNIDFFVNKKITRQLFFLVEFNIEFLSLLIIVLSVSSRRIYLLYHFYIKLYLFTKAYFAIKM